MTDATYDIAIIGGGINGMGIAAEAASQGYRVFLCEQADFASGTSSASSKLIHGGLHYLEHGAFRLVRESLQERAYLLTEAPSLVQGKSFIFPHATTMRPAWLIRLGLWLYDWLSPGNLLPKSRCIALPDSSPLKQQYHKAFQYYDAYCDDARLVLANAHAARAAGATLVNYTQCTSIDEQDDHWQLQLTDCYTQETYTATSKLVINASGPWLSQSHLFPKHTTPPKLRLVKGSHIIVKSFYESQEAYTLQAKDKRIIFVIPYREHYALIGTTEHEYAGDPQHAKITENEINYLLDIVATYFKHPPLRQDVIHSFSGVRPLLLENNTRASETTREYKIDHLQDNHPPFINIIGGKLTSYRRLAAKCVKRIRSVVTPSLNKQQIIRLEHSASDIPKTGMHFGHDLYQSEIDFYIQHEWAKTVDDIIWRRTKLGLLLTDEEVQKLENYMDSLKTLSDIT